MTEQDLKAKGFSVPIFRAVEAAGGPIAVAYHMGLKSTQAVNHWITKRTIPTHRIHKLCELGGNAITAADIAKDVAEFHAESRVAA